MHETLDSWIAGTARPGDLLLTGDGGVAGRIIQRVTSSRFSHASLVYTTETIVEAYDYALTPNEDDEGVYETPFAKLEDRSSSLCYARLLRPDALSEERFIATCEKYLSMSPTFASTGLALQAVAYQLSKNKLRRGETTQSDVLTALLDFQALLVGDGSSTVQCAELATRIYTEAGLRLTFTEPFLSPLIQQVATELETSVTGALTMKGPVVVRSTDFPRRAEGGKWSMTTPADAVRALAARLTKQDIVDMADFIVPADFERAAPFAYAGGVCRRNDIWVDER